MFCRLQWQKYKNVVPIGACVDLVENPPIALSLGIVLHIILKEKKKKKKEENFPQKRASRDL